MHIPFHLSSHIHYWKRSNRCHPEFLKNLFSGVRKLENASKLSIEVTTLDRWNQIDVSDPVWGTQHVVSTRLTLSSVMHRIISPQQRSPEEGLFQDRSLSWRNESLIPTFESFPGTLCLHHVHSRNGRKDLSDEECLGVWDLGSHGSSTTVAAHGYFTNSPWLNSGNSEGMIAACPAPRYTDDTLPWGSNSGSGTNVRG